MWMCRQVAKALAEGDYMKLPRRRRMGMKVHVLLCAMCGKYHRQVMDIQDGVRGFLEHEEEGDPEIAPDLHLSDQARDRMKKILHDA